MDKAEEFDYIMGFARESDFDCDIGHQQLRCLWTAYCFHNCMDVDTGMYDRDLQKIWEQIEPKAPPLTWNSIIDFDLYMGEYLC